MINLFMNVKNHRNKENYKQELLKLFEEIIIHNEDPKLDLSYIHIARYELKLTYYLSLSILVRSQYLETWRCT